MIRCSVRAPEDVNYLPLGAAFPRPPPDGFPVVLGRLATAGAFDPPDFPELDPAFPPLDFDMTISLVTQSGVALPQ